MKNEKSANFYSNILVNIIWFEYNNVHEHVKPSKSGYFKTKLYKKKQGEMFALGLPILSSYLNLKKK